MTTEDLYINLTEENIAFEHLCCLIRQKPHPGIERKRAWLTDRLREGHVFRKLNAKGVAFIEYAPLETAWTPVLGDNWMYLYCLWTEGALKGKGHGKALLEYCLADAKAKGKSGVCALGADTQKHWLTSQSFLMKYGFAPVDQAAGGYTLLALPFDETRPQFSDGARAGKIAGDGLTVYFSPQCPYLCQLIDGARAFCDENGVPAALIPVDTLEKAKALPCVFNNCAVFWNGTFQTVNLPDAAYLKRLTRKGEA